MQPQSIPSTKRRLRLGVAAFAAATMLLVGACTSASDNATTTDTTAADGAKGGQSLVFRSLDSGGPQTVAALKKNSIDLALLFTFSPAIAENNWVTLQDDKHLQAADNFIPLIRTDKATDDVKAVVEAVDAKLTHEDLFAMVREVAVDGQNPEDVASAWLKKNKVPGDLKASGKITVASANFAESEIVGALYHLALKDAGMQSTLKGAVGTRQVTVPLMEKGEIDLMPEFTFSLLKFLDANAEPSNNLDDVVAALKKAVEPKGMEVLEPTDISDVNVIVTTEKTAKKFNLSKISDLANVTESLTLGGPPECPKNAQCLIGLKDVYGLQFTEK